jgi:ABC-type antimicrobial peptide transport system permease subunit
MTNTKFSIIPIYLPLVSLAISIAVGLISGYFPARRATKISAIEAMKTEG